MYYIDFGGAFLDPIWEVIIAHASSNDVISVFWTAECSKLTPEETSFDFNTARSLLVEGVISGVTIGPMMVYSPHFCGGKLSQWYGTIECLDVDVSLFLECKSNIGLDFVALCVDDQVELDVEIVNVNTFPWGDWRVIRAAVRDDDGSWVDRTMKPAEL